MATTLAELATEALAAASKPYAVRNDKLTTRQHRLKDLVELHSYLASQDAVAQEDIVATLRTNMLIPGGITGVITQRLQTGGAE